MAGGIINFTNVTSSYNVSTAATFIGGTGNVNNYDIVTDPPFNVTVGRSLDEGYQIIAGSTLKTLGSSSSEVGAFGGTAPYVVSGIAPVPTISSFVNTGTGDSTTPVKVTITVKSNN